jgi:hypothetical protein
MYVIISSHPFAQEPQQPPAPQEVKVKKTISEEKRLARTIDLIDFDCALVPRAALTLDASHVVSPNITFEGR